MTNFFTYDSSGNITGSGFSENGEFPLNSVECTPDQAATPRAWQVVNSALVAASAATLAAQAQAKLKADAQTELDIVTGPRGTIMRCIAAPVPIPAEWSAYVLALRAIANGTDTTSTALPTRPAYPAGT